MTLNNNILDIKDLQKYLTKVLKNEASTKNFHKLVEWDYINQDIDTLEKTISVLTELTWTNDEFRATRDLLQEQLEEYKKVRLLLKNVILY